MRSSLWRCSSLMPGATGTATMPPRMPAQNASMKASLFARNSSRRSPGRAPEPLQVMQDAERALVQLGVAHDAPLLLALVVGDRARGAAVGLQQLAQRGGIHAGRWRLTLPGKPRIVMRMNRVILAYSRLHGQLPAAVRARWRARLTPAHALRLSTDPRAQSRTLLGVALACRLLSAAGGRRVEPHELRYSRHGRPHAPGLPDFSIAHAGAWVVCALASGGAVGVDIEPVGEPRGIAGLAGRVRHGRAGRGALAAAGAGDLDREGGGAQGGRRHARRAGAGARARAAGGISRPALVLPRAAPRARHGHARGDGPTGHAAAARAVPASVALAP